MCDITEINKFVDLQTEMTPTGEVLISNTELGTKIKVTKEALAENTLGTIVMCLDQGKNVSQITRITGYFSVVDAWNKGKVAELKDRYRTGSYFTA